MDLGWYALDHLTPADLAWISQIGNRGRPEAPLSPAQLLARPALVGRLLEDPALVRAWFARPDPPELNRLSPFLSFWLVLARTAQDLAQAQTVQEWVGPGQRLYVFDVEPLRQLAADRATRFFLAELLASYTRVESGALRVRDRRGWRRLRYSELDPWGWLQLIDVVTPAEKVWVYRRLGDLALFLTGVFPDYVAGLSAAGWRRWRRAEAALGAPAATDTDRLGWLEALGRRAYAAALGTAPAPTAALALVRRVAEGFQTARRFLNVTTDRYLLPQRRWWFPAAQG